MSGSESATRPTLAGIATNSARRIPWAYVFASSAYSRCAARVDNDGSAAVDSAITKMPCGKSQRRIAQEK